MKNNKKLYLAILSLLLLIGNASFAAKEKKYVLSSPDGTLKVEISAGNELAYQVMHGNDTILSHSNIGLVLENGTIVGKTPRITGERRRKIKDNIESPFYRFKEFVATGTKLRAQIIPFFRHRSHHAVTVPCLKIIPITDNLQRSR